MATQKDCLQFLKSVLEQDHFQKQLDPSSVQTKLSGFSFDEPSSLPLFCFLAPLAQTINTDQFKNITETFEMKWRKQTDIQLVDHIDVNSVFGDSGGPCKHEKRYENDMKTIV